VIVGLCRHDRCTVETGLHNNNFGSGRVNYRPSANNGVAFTAESAYLRAAARSFDGGDAVADWLASEQDVDALLSRGGD